VVQIVDETYGDVVYTLRIKGTKFRPKVFRDGLYTVKIGQPDNLKVLKNLEATPENDKMLRVSFTEN
jgi:hypothetical protein